MSHTLELRELMYELTLIERKLRGEGEFWKADILRLAWEALGRLKGLEK